MSRRVPMRALVRRRSNRTGTSGSVDWVQGDVTRPETLPAAVAGCDVVFHCAWGGGSLEDSRRVNVEGTRNVVEAAARAGVRRVVHLSTMAVHGDRLARRPHRRRSPRSPAATPTASARRKARPWPGSSAPSSASRWSSCVRRWCTAQRAPFWVVGYCERVKREEVALVDGGRGLANLLFVEDLVDAMWAAAEVNGAAGEVCLVSGPRPVTWARVPRPLRPHVRQAVAADRCRAGAPASRCSCCVSTEPWRAARGACRAWTSASCRNGPRCASIMRAACSAGRRRPRWTRAWPCARGGCGARGIYLPGGACRLPPGWSAWPDEQSHLQKLRVHRREQRARADVLPRPGPGDQPASGRGGAGQVLSR